MSDEPVNFNSYLFTFGKHKWERLVDVLEFDASYIIWCHENVKWFNLNDEDLEMVITYAEEQKDSKRRDYEDRYSSEGFYHWF